MHHRCGGGGSDVNGGVEFLFSGGRVQVAAHLRDWDERRAKEGTVKELQAGPGMSMGAGWSRHVWAQRASLGQATQAC